MWQITPKIGYFYNHMLDNITGMICVNLEIRRAQSSNIDNFIHRHRISCRLQIHAYRNAGQHKLLPFFLPFFFLSSLEGFPSTGCTGVGVEPRRRLLRASSERNNQQTNYQNQNKDRLKAAASRSGNAKIPV